METVNTVGQLISIYGFPIVASGALFWFIIKENREMRTIIDRNTSVLLRILEHIKKGEEE